MFYADIPFGNVHKTDDDGIEVVDAGGGAGATSDQPWNHRMSEEEMTAMLTSFKTNNTLTKFFAIIKCHFRDSEMVEKSLRTVGFKNIQFVVVYAVNANVKGVQKFTPSCQVVVYGFFPNSARHDWTWEGETNPTRRHNLAVVKNVTSFFKMDGVQTPANSAQSPLSLASLLVSPFTLAPSHEVFVACGGVGSDAISLAGMGRQVIMAEKDQFMQRCIKTRLKRLQVLLERDDGPANLRDYCDQADGPAFWGFPSYQSHLQNMVDEVEAQKEDERKDAFDSTHCPVCDGALTTEKKFMTCSECDRESHIACMTATQVSANVVEYRCNDMCEGSTDGTKGDGAGSEGAN